MRCCCISERTMSCRFGPAASGVRGCSIDFGARALNFTGQPHQRVSCACGINARLAITPRFSDPLSFATPTIRMMRSMSHDCSRCVLVVTVTSRARVHARRLFHVHAHGQWELDDITLDVRLAVNFLPVFVRARHSGDTLIPLCPILYLRPRSSVMSWPLYTGAMSTQQSSWRR